MIKKVLYGFEHYFLFFVISSIISIITGKGYIMSILFPCMTYMIVFTKCRRLKLTIFDVLFFIIFFVMILSWILNSYSNKNILIFRCFMGECSYMAVYFIGKKYGFNIFSNIIENSYVILIICNILGIIFFFKSPGAWYMSQNIELYDELGYEGMVYEAMRMKSIFSSPYVLAYFNSIVIMYILSQLPNISEKKYWGYLVILLVGLLFCMMRAPFVCMLFGSLLLLYHNRKYVNLKIIRYFIIGLLLLLILLYGGKMLVNVDVLNFFDAKVQSVSHGLDVLVSERINLYNFNYSLFGDGAGRHAIYVDDYNPRTSIRDSEYIRLLVELGYIGIVIYVLFFVMLIVKCIKYFKYLSFDLCVIMFYFITMIGADSLSTPDKHSLLFWLVVGHVSVFPLKKNYDTD